MIVLAFALGALPAAECQGTYSYVPERIRNEIPFSLQVGATRVTMKAMDFDGFEVPAERQKDASLRFSNEQGTARYHLVCRADRASVSVAYNDGKTINYRMIRTRSDIWGVAKARGWPIGD